MQQGQNPMQQIQQLQQQLANAQARAFELVSQISADRDAHQNNAQNLQGIVGEVVRLLELEDPQITEVYDKIQELMTDPEEKPEPELKEVPTKRGKK